MQKIEYTLGDVQALVQTNREFALALENVVLKRMLEEYKAQKDSQKTVKAAGTYK